MATGVEFVDKILTSLDLSNPLSLGINIILSTLIGGLVFLLVVKLLSSKFHEGVKSYHAFLVVFVINLINMFGIINLIPVISAFPALIVQALIWIILTKIAFRASIAHSIVIGIVGFVVSILIIPYLVSMVVGYVPL